MAHASSVQNRARRGIRALAALLTIFGASVAGSTLAGAQTLDPSTAGTSYIIAFPDTTANLSDPRAASYRVPLHDTLLAMIYSPTANTVTVTGTAGRSKQFTMAAGGFQTVLLNETSQELAPIVDVSGIATDKTFRIDAQQPVVVYCFLHTGFGTEAFTPAPVSAWGTSYYAAALPGEVMYDMTPETSISYQKIPKAAPAEILVIASEDATTVTITPNGNLDKNPPKTITLNKGQCYQVQSYVDTNSFNLGIPQPDLGGSFIRANKPIGVVSGNTRSQVLNNSGGLGMNSFKNMMIEWISPTDQHGTQFVYLPTLDAFAPTGQTGEKPEEKRPGEVVRVYGTAGDPGEATPTVTEMTEQEGLSGMVLRTERIFRSQFDEALIGAPVPHVFKTSMPAQAFMNTTAVVKFNGTTGSGTKIGASYLAQGTYMVELTPREQWPSAAPYYAPGILFSSEHYLNVVADSVTMTGLRINGQPFTDLRHIVGTKYLWTSKKLLPEERGVIAGANDTSRFFAFVYGSHGGEETFTPDSSGKQPALYLESIGHMYGYPLAPRRLKTTTAGVGTESIETGGSRIDRIDPNPAISDATIQFHLGASGRTTAEIFDAMGMKVTTLADGLLGEGPHTLRWNAAGLPSGVYYCRIVSGAWSVTRPLLLTR